jgi:cell wall-associated NlpC family hydrolase
MPFTRQRHNGTNETHPRRRTETSLDRMARNRTIHIPPRIVGILALSTTATLLTNHSTVARARANSTQNRRLPGAWGWTTGSQTYLRVRPSAMTPAVAKVPKRTRMFIWGTYNGWYRVETSDHIFGWVYYSYINCPKSEKLAELSNRKAKVASDRSARQTMYGSPQLLRRYYAQYHAPGATKGLREMGIRVASAPKSRSSYRSAAGARSFARSTAYRTKPVKSSLRVATRPAAKSFTRASVRPAVVTMRVRPRPAVATYPPLVSIPGPTVEDRNSTPLAPSQPDAVAAQRATEQRAAARQEARRIAAQRAAMRVAALRAAEDRAAAQKAVEQRAIAQRMAARRAAEQRAAEQRAEAQRAAAQRMAALRAAEDRAAAQKAAARRAARERAAARRVAALKAAEQRKRDRQSRLAQQRAHLRQQMGAPVSMTPPMGLPGLRPISPEELLRARDAFLSSGRKPAPPAPSNGHSNLQGMSFKGGVGNDARPPAITPSSFESGSFQSAMPSSALSYGTFDDIVSLNAIAMDQEQETELPQLPQIPHVLVMSHAKIIAQAVGNIGYDTREPAIASPSPKNGLFGTPEGVVNSENLILPQVLPMQPSVQSSVVQPSAAQLPTTQRSAPQPVTTQQPVAPQPFAVPPANAQRTVLPPVVVTFRPAYVIPLQIVQTTSTSTVKLYSRRPRWLAPAKAAPAKIAPARITSKVRANQGTLPSRGGSPRDYIAAMPQTSFGQGMANQALSYRGMPYIFGAESPSRGFDCSGLIYFLLRQRGYNPPRTAAGLAYYGTRVSQGSLEPGDILLFANTYKRGVSHAGVYLGNGKFVHAASTGRGVRVDALSTRYWARKYHSARRVK